MQKIASYYITNPHHGLDESQVQGLKEKLGLNDAQLSELWDAFMLFDKNGDGAISPLEITVVMRSLGNSSNPYTSILLPLINVTK